ncbi:hypothetical protein C9374_007711 [Naegleria lovaniensis]|uniref:[RNA-polymerase]-subunit kinase n=1 Tax=Naegleria lovaniensis TaxID=51637 RepID=A0AA88GMM8_NAELO|nr:uncharacterized protein C9374_007711 [Naegleria lovaniensis]KAG2379073.1 hypothetical protein C9374_007711 [Naegleria lovaniensis]
MSKNYPTQPSTTSSGAGDASSHHHHHHISNSSNSNNRSTSTSSNSRQHQNDKYDSESREHGRRLHSDHYYDSKRSSSRDDRQSNNYRSDDRREYNDSRRESYHGSQHHHYRDDENNTRNRSDSSGSGGRRLGTNENRNSSSNGSTSHRHSTGSSSSSGQHSRSSGTSSRNDRRLNQDHYHSEGYYTNKEGKRSYHDRGDSYYDDEAHYDEGSYPHYSSRYSSSSQYYYSSQQHHYGRDGHYSYSRDSLYSNRRESSSSFTTTCFEKYGKLSEAFAHLSGPFKIKSYEEIEVLGAGTYGEIKNDPNATNGFPITTIREIKILKELDHINIVKLHDVTWDDSSFYMIFEFVDHDLSGLSEMNVTFTEDHLRCLMYQLVEGLYFCHANNVLHRDLKKSNILIKRDGTLKIADFGLSLFKKRDNIPYTNKVVTLWYRSPEVLLGSQYYDGSIDMWSVGCILGELIKKEKGLFQGTTESDQLHKIFKICGAPNLEDWPEVMKLPHWDSMKPVKQYPNVIRKMFSDASCSPKAIDLIERLLTLNPQKRLTAKECLEHEWFWENGNPLKFKPGKILPKMTTNEYTAHKQRPQKKQKQADTGDSGY